jgi:hypothetical protein
MFLLVANVASAVTVNPTEFNDKLGKLAYYIHKVDISTDKPENFYLYFECSNNDEACNWASFVSGTTASPNITFQLKANQVTSVYVEVVIPNDYAFQEHTFSVVVQGSTVVKIPYTLKVYANEDWLSKITEMIFGDFWNREIYHFPNSSIPPIYGGTIILISLAIIIISIVVGIILWARK